LQGGSADTSSGERESEVSSDGSRNNLRCFKERATKFTGRHHDA